jgi:hypothetical protein
MREGDDHEDTRNQEVGEFAVRNLTEFFYAGRPAVIVRTTYLQGSEEGRKAPQGVQQDSGRS